jgi:hypothetical protein
MTALYRSWCIKAKLLRDALTQQVRNKAELRAELTEQQMKYEGKTQLMIDDIPLVLFASEPKGNLFERVDYDVSHGLDSLSRHTGHPCC